MGSKEDDVGGTYSKILIGKPQGKGDHWEA